jgi:hypothetical protein
MTMKFLLTRPDSTPAQIDKSMTRVEDLSREIDQAIDRHPGLFTDEIVSALVRNILGRVITTNPADERRGFAEALKSAFSAALEVHFPDHERMH